MTDSSPDPTQGTSPKTDRETIPDRVTGKEKGLSKVPFDNNSHGWFVIRRLTGAAGLMLAVIITTFSIDLDFKTVIAIIGAGLWIGYRIVVRSFEYLAWYDLRNNKGATHVVFDDDHAAGYINPQGKHMRES